MARQAKAKIRVLVEVEEFETDVGADSATIRLPHRIEYNLDLESGTTDGTQIDRVYSSDASLSTTPTDLDLSGSLASALNGSNTVVLADLVLIAVENTTAAGGGTSNVGGDAAAVTGWVADATDVVKVGPKGLFLWIAPSGTTVTATTADVLQLVASTGTVTNKIIVAGRSA
jgi:hypothetical protein